MAEYVIACIVMGAGIGIDVMIATVGRFRHFKILQDGYSWVRRLTTTHILLPMIGYYGFTALNRLLPGYEVILGIIASGLIAWFLWQLVCEWISKDDEDQMSGGAIRAASWGAVMAVSWDALMSGPAKSAQAIYWTPVEIVISFFIAGITVTAMTILALVISVRLNRRQMGSGADDINRLVNWEFIGLASEFMIIGYFGVLAIDRYVFGANLPVIVDFATSATLTLTVFLIFKDRFKSVIRGKIEDELTHGCSETVQS
jgi:hypothetical protein